MSKIIDFTKQGKENETDERVVLYPYRAACLLSFMRVHFACVPFLAVRLSCHGLTDEMAGRAFYGVREDKNPLIAFSGGAGLCM